MLSTTASSLMVCGLDRPGLRSLRFQWPKSVSSHCPVEEERIQIATSVTDEIILGMQQKPPPDQKEEDEGLFKPKSRSLPN